MQAQRTFSERFAESYPTPGDEMHRIASQFAEGSQRLYDHFIRNANPDMTAYNNIHHQVTLYIREIESVEAYHSRLIAAKSEADRYQSKIDYMERKKKHTDETKKTRNLLKMDVEKVNYRKLLNEAIEKQKATYAKYPVVFKAALVSYWLSHEKHVTMLVESLKETQAFAKAAEAEMARLDIRALEMPFKKDVHVVHSVEFHMEEEKKQREHLQEMSSSLGKLAMPKEASRVGSDVVNYAISNGDRAENSGLMKTRSLLQSPAGMARGLQDSRLLRARSMRERTLEKKGSAKVEELEQKRFTIPGLVEKQASIKEAQFKKEVSPKNEELGSTLYTKMDELEKSLSTGNDELDKNQSTKNEKLEKTLSATIEELRKNQSSKTEDREQAMCAGEGQAGEVSSVKEFEMATSASLHTDVSQRSISASEHVFSESSSSKDSMNDMDMVDRTEKENDAKSHEKFDREGADVGKETAGKDGAVSFKDVEAKLPLEQDEKLMTEESNMVQARSVKVIAEIYEAGEGTGVTKTTQEGL